MKETPVSSHLKETPVSSHLKETPVSSHLKETPVSSHLKETPVSSHLKETPVPVPTSWFSFRSTVEFAREVAEVKAMEDSINRLEGMFGGSGSHETFTAPRRGTSLATGTGRCAVNT